MKKKQSKKNLEQTSTISSEATSSSTTNNKTNEKKEESNNNNNATTATVVIHDSTADNNNNSITADQLIALLGRNNNEITGRTRGNRNLQRARNHSTASQLDEIEQLQRDLRVMEAFFQSLLGQAYQMGMDPGGFQTQQQSENTAPPPASNKAMRQVPTVRVCAEDLVDENNRECCICFEENKVGGKVARLPCGHVYHRPCIEGWLRKHCTCPVCRYELETEDPNYERGRLERMRTRKPRFRKHELQNLTIRQLRDLFAFLRIDTKDDNGNMILEKRELVEKIMNSGRIELIASPEPLDFKLSELRSMGIGKLKKTMNEAGVFFDPADVVEKEDMVHIFINSGRVSLILEEEALEDVSLKNYDLHEEKHNMDWEIAETDEAGIEIKPYASSTHDDHSEVIVEDASTEEEDGTYRPEYNNHVDLNPGFEESQNSNPVVPSPAPPPSTSFNDQSQLKTYLTSCSISELKAIGRQLGVGLSDCVEKSDMVDRLRLQWSRH